MDFCNQSLGNYKFYLVKQSETLLYFAVWWKKYSTRGRQRQSYNPQIKYIWFSPRYWVHTPFFFFLKLCSSPGPWFKKRTGIRSSVLHPKKQTQWNRFYTLSDFELSHMHRKSYTSSKLYNCSTLLYLFILRIYNKIKFF